MNPIMGRSWAAISWLFKVFVLIESGFMRSVIIAAFVFCSRESWSTAHLLYSHAVGLFGKVVSVQYLQVTSRFHKFHYGNEPGDLEKKRFK